MLKTEYEELNKIIGDLEKRQLVAIAGRPGSGKSTLALNIINNAFKQTNDKILYFNFETSKDSLKAKIMSDNVEIIDTPNITIEEIKSKCEEFAKSGLSLVVIDYMQLIKSSTEDIEHTSKILKEIANELNIPVLVLSQLTKQQVTILTEDNSTNLNKCDVSPLLQDSDKVILLYEEKLYKIKW